MPQQQETGAQQQPGSQSGSGGGDGKQAGGKQNGGGGQDDQQPIKLNEVEQMQMDQVGGAKAISQKIGQQADKLCQDIQLLGSNYSWRGICKKCGWQTMQFDKQQAHALVKRHALKHWRELIGEQQAKEQQQQQAQQQGQQSQQQGQQPPQTHPQQPSAQPQQQRQQPVR